MSGCASGRRGPFGSSGPFQVTECEHYLTQMDQLQATGGLPLGRASIPAPKAGLACARRARRVRLVAVVGVRRRPHRRRLRPRRWRLRRRLAVILRSLGGLANLPTAVRRLGVCDGL